MIYVLKFAFFVAVFQLWLCSPFADNSASNQPDGSRNNWAVLVGTSRYWYNYRHTANILSFYRSLRRLGVPDDQIILLSADDIACNPRNPFAGTVFNDKHKPINLYGDSIEVDYRGDEVTVSNFIRLLTGRQPPWTPRSKRLLTDGNSNVFIFMTGHGGDEFIKFRDWEELSSQDMADAFHQMWSQGRYKRLFYLTDSCQSATLQKRFYSPNIVAAGCSRLGENSFSHHSDTAIGVPVIDRFTYYSLQYFETLQPWSNVTMADYFNQFDPTLLLSHPEARTDLFDKNLNDTLLMEFLASTGSLKYIRHPFPIQKRSPDHRRATVDDDQDYSKLDRMHTFYRKRYSWSYDDK